MRTTRQRLSNASVNHQEEDVVRALRAARRSSSKDKTKQRFALKDPVLLELLEKQESTGVNKDRSRISVIGAVIDLVPTPKVSSKRPAVTANQERNEKKTTHPSQSPSVSTPSSSQERPTRRAAQTASSIFSSSTKESPQFEKRATRTITPEKESSTTPSKASKGVTAKDTSRPLCHNKKRNREIDKNSSKDSTSHSGGHSKKKRVKRTTVGKAGTRGSNDDDNLHEQDLYRNVYFGRGGDRRKQPLKSYYRSLVEKHFEEYLALPLSAHDEKQEFTRNKIMRKVLKNGGHFYERAQDKKGRSIWLKLDAMGKDEKEVSGKVKQAMRDMKKVLQWRADHVGATILEKKAVTKKKKVPRSERVARIPISKRDVRIENSDSASSSSSEGESVMSESEADDVSDRESQASSDEESPSDTEEESSSSESEGEDAWPEENEGDFNDESSIESSQSYKKRIKASRSRSNYRGIPVKKQEPKQEYDYEALAVKPSERKLSSSEVPNLPIRTDLGNKSVEELIPEPSKSVRQSGRRTAIAQRQKITLNLKHVLFLEPTLKRQEKKRRQHQREERRRLRKESRRALRKEARIRRREQRERAQSKANRNYLLDDFRGSAVVASRKGGVPAANRLPFVSSVAKAPLRKMSAVAAPPTTFQVELPPDAKERPFTPVILEESDEEYDVAEDNLTTRMETDSLLDTKPSASKTFSKSVFCPPIPKGTSSEERTEFPDLKAAAMSVAQYKPGSRNMPEETPKLTALSANLPPLANRSLLRPSLRPTIASPSAVALQVNGSALLGPSLLGRPPSLTQSAVKMRQRVLAIEFLMAASDVASIFSGIAILCELYHDERMAHSITRLVAESKTTASIILRTTLTGMFTKPILKGGLGLLPYEADILCQPALTRLLLVLQGDWIIRNRDSPSFGLTHEEGVVILPTLIAIADGTRRKYLALSRELSLIGSHALASTLRRSL